MKYINPADPKISKNIDEENSLFKENNRARDRYKSKATEENSNKIQETEDALEEFRIKNKKLSLHTLFKNKERRKRD